MIRWFVDLWDRKEAPDMLALIRIGVGLCLLWDFGWAGIYDLVEVLWTPSDGGGFAHMKGRKFIPLVWQYFPHEPRIAVALWGVVMMAALAMTLGFATPLSCVVLMLAYAQTAQTLSLADRGIDLMMRNVLFILAFSSCGAKWSVDSLLRFRSWSGDGKPRPAWPRHLLIVQIVVMYFLAGVQKTALAWTPLGGYTALYTILHDPHIARFAYGDLLDTALPLLRLSAFATHVFELTPPLLLLVYHYRSTRDRPGRESKWLLRFHFREVWVTVGVLLHIGIALSMNLGIFPFAMLALYWAFFHPDELHSAVQRIRGQARRISA